MIDLVLDALDLRRGDDRALPAMANLATDSRADISEIGRRFLGKRGNSAGAPLEQVAGGRLDASARVHHVPAPSAARCSMKRAISAMVG